jgi:hypothetical protein
MLTNIKVNKLEDFGLLVENVFSEEEVLNVLKDIESFSKDTEHSNPSRWNVLEIDDKNINFLVDRMADVYREVLHNLTDEKEEYNYRAQSLKIYDWVHGCFISEHVDKLPYDDIQTQGIRSDITGLLYLTDNYVGAQIYFPNSKIQLKPKPGSFLMFKSETVHAVDKFISGTRQVSHFNLYRNDNPKINTETDAKFMPLFEKEK